VKDIPIVPDATVPPGEIRIMRPRTPSEIKAYMDGQLNALRLADEKGVEYARWIIEGSQQMMRSISPEAEGARRQNDPQT